MKLKDLLTESPDKTDSGDGVCVGCGMPCDPDVAYCDECGYNGEKPVNHDENIEDDDDYKPNDEDLEACPGCGRGPGDGYGADCEDPTGCGYWKDFAREAMAELRSEMKKERNVDEGVNMFGDFMDKTLELEEQRRERKARPLVEESYGHSIQRRFQELPQNRIRITVKK